jgi:two-component system, OmpR family, sensor histidine kinase KdpD
VGYCGRVTSTAWRPPPKTTWLLGYGAALATVTLVSLSIGFVLGRINLANASMLYLFAVLATAVAFGRGPAVFAALIAFLTFDWFFVQPVHQFTVSDPEEWVSLLLFMLTATVTGQLAAGQRQRRREAEQRQREAIVLYDVVRLMSDSQLEDGLAAVAERLRNELNLPALAVEFWEPSGELVRVGAGVADALSEIYRSAAPARVLHSGRAASSNEHATPGRWVRIVPAERSHATESPETRAGKVDVVPIKVGERRIGAVVLLHRTRRFDAVDNRLVSAAATQIGLAVDRDRLHKESTEAEILRRTDQLRAALLNAVSHDLRTPLAAIMASAGSLRQQDVQWTEEERQSFAEAIEEEAERLNRLVGNLLDLSRIEGGSLRPDKSWHDLGAVVEDTLDRLRSVVADHDLRVSVPEDLPPVWLDPVEIGEALYNLVENAAKYSPPHTEIDVEVRQAADHVAVSVSDRGPGLPATALQHVFESFYRAIQSGGAPQPGGLGLGLAVVKGLVEAHGGRVSVENRGGGGARFTFTLPRAASAANTPPAPEVSAA